jgi:hypothetical protein
LSNFGNDGGYICHVTTMQHPAFTVCVLSSCGPQ